MVKKSKRPALHPPVSRRTRIIIIPILCIIGLATIVLTVLSIIFMPKSDPGSQYGVGANGFQAFVEDKSDLGMKSIVTKNQVVAALGAKARSVGDAEVSKVFNFNANRSQAVTYPFVRTDGVTASLYVDMKIYKNSQSLDDDHIYASTAKAGTINGRPAFYKHAQTVSGDREYHMLVVNGLKAYRFVIAQPAKNITITELSAMATLKKLALDVKF